MITVGMNYEILPGKESKFEQVFDSVVELIKTLAGHDETHLYKGVKNSQMYLVISQWSDRASFDAFIKSEKFTKVVNWGKEEVLASRPKHEVYGDSSPDPQSSSACPVAH